MEHNPLCVLTNYLGAKVLSMSHKVNRNISRKTYKFGSHSVNRRFLMKFEKHFQTGWSNYVAFWNLSIRIPWDLFPTTSTTTVHRQQFTIRNYEPISPYVVSLQIWDQFILNYEICIFAEWSSYFKEVQFLKKYYYF